MSIFAKLLIISGVCLIIAGLVWHFSGGNIPIGRLPGDLKIQRGNSTIYIPITTCIVISSIISLIRLFISK